MSASLVREAGVTEDRTPMVVEFGGVQELRLVTYQGFPVAVPWTGGRRW